MRNRGGSDSRKRLRVTKCRCFNRQVKESYEMPMSWLLSGRSNSLGANPYDVTYMTKIY